MALTYSSYKTLGRGDKAPDFFLPGIDGKNYSPKNFNKAKALLIVFMCNHCPFVQPKVSKLVQLHKDYAAKGLAIVGINANDTTQYPDDSFENMKLFAKEKGIGFAYLFDESQETPKKYGATCTPDPFLFDSGMRLAYHGRIDDAHKQEPSKAKTNELEEAIKQVLAGKEVGVQVLPSMGCNIKWKQ